ncbi:MAG: hypothetical protein GX811_01060 [Lentisphaerae bacterium]|nr:hypothetical protein [Lentisphaerota bacterium]
MKRNLIIGLALSVLLLPGCLVRSLYPWLTEDSLVTDVCINGLWHDDSAETSVFFVDSEPDGHYKILFVGSGNRCHNFVGALYKLDDTYYLMARAPEWSGINEIVNQPCHMLFKVDVTEDIIKLYDIDKKAFKKLSVKFNLNVFEGLSDEAPPLLLSKTADIVPVIQGNSGEKRLFSNKPVYSFKKFKGKQD